MIENQYKQKQHHDDKLKKPFRELQPNERVLVRNTIKNCWEKGSVIAKTGNVTYNVNVNGKNLSKHIDHLVKFNDTAITSDHNAPQLSRRTNNASTVVSENKRYNLRSRMRK